MRFQGRITEWKDDRGFGFITPNGGGPRVFLHFRAMQSGEPRPTVGEMVTYESVAVPGKGPRAENVSHVDRKPSRRTAAVEERRGGWGGTLAATIALAIIIALGYFAAQHYAAKRAATRSGPQAEDYAAPAAPRPRPLAEQIAPGSTAKFSCDGRTMCSQMTSCEEAKYFLKNCPGVKMDGNGDGVPCERQWCK